MARIILLNINDLSVSLCKLRLFHYASCGYFIVQVVAISLCKLRIFPLPFSKKDGYFKAFALTGRRGITKIKPRAIALGYELLPFQGVRRQQTALQP